MVMVIFILITGSAALRLYLMPVIIALATVALVILPTEHPSVAEV